MVLFLTVFTIAGMGIAMCYSASAVFALNHYGDAFYFLKKQLIWFFAGFIALLAFQEIDYRKYSRYTGIMLIVMAALLIAVIIPGIGEDAKGSARWINIGILNFQPSEFVKVVTVIYLAKAFSSENTDNPVVQILVPLTIVAAMSLLILLQPDFGTAVDILIVAVTLFFVSGFSLLYILTLFVISIPMFYLIIYQVDYRKARLLAYLDPWADRFGSGYHIIQSFIAFKKGALLGVGLGFGTQKLQRLPEPHTDFIFAVIAEEVGLFGTVLIVLLFCMFFMRAVSISLTAPDRFGKLLAIGLGLMVTVQAFINMGVVTGLLPTTGIPLPMISYGGSSFLTTMIAAGILLNISRNRDYSSAAERHTDEVWN